MARTKLTASEWENFTQRQNEQTNDTESRRLARTNSEVRQNEQTNDTESRRVARTNPEVREKFYEYVKTTNDVSQSNCKLADDKETIVATRIITTGEEIQCYYDATDNNKSAGDKRKQSEDYDDNLRDNNDSSNTRRKNTDNNKSAGDKS